MAISLTRFWVAVMEKYLPMFVERNYSEYGAINWLNTINADYSRNRFLTIFRNAQKQVWSRPLIANIPLTSKVPLDLRTTREFLKPRKYMYHFKVRTVDERTGAVTMRRRSLYEMKDLTVGTALAHAKESFGKWNYENYGFLATNYTFDYMEVNEASL